MLPNNQAGSNLVPRHLAVIMDGNGRWAQKRGLNRVKGHQQGAEAVRQIIKNAARSGIEILTLFAFSSENWKRPSFEVSALMTLFAKVLKSERQNLVDAQVKTKIIGDVSRFSFALQKEIAILEDATSHGTRMQLNIAANYGGRWDILNATRKIHEDLCLGKIQEQELSEDLFKSYLAVPYDVDLLIRTGGEHRISNFLMYQSSYSEFYISDTLWPDFDLNELNKAISFFRSRQRRFGMTGDQVKNKEVSC